MRVDLEIFESLSELRSNIRQLEASMNALRDIASEQFKKITLDMLQVSKDDGARADAARHEDSALVLSPPKTSNVIKLVRA